MTIHPRSLLRPITAALAAFSVLVLLASAPGLRAQVIGNAGGGWSLRGTDPIQIYHGEDLITVYHTAKDQARPYFYPLIGPTGENMTRHWPMKEGVEGEADDHPHHQGMWFGLGKVNGLDFWHEPSDKSKKDKVFGTIQHQGMNGFSTSEGGMKVTFRTKSDWVAHANPSEKVCSDEREFSLSYREDGALVFDVAITLVADSGDIEIVDDKEGAWAIRTLPTLRLEGEVAQGEMVSSEGVSGKGVWGKRAKWIDNHGPDPQGNKVGIAILDHPGNLRHPTWWHARHYGLFAPNPFGQGHFEKGAAEDSGNYTVEDGEKLTLRYRIIFHEGDEKAAKIAEAWEAFAEE